MTTTLEEQLRNEFIGRRYQLAHIPDATYKITRIEIKGHACTFYADKVSISTGNVETRDVKLQPPLYDFVERDIAVQIEPQIAR